MKSRFCCASSYEAPDRRTDPALIQINPHPVVTGQATTLIEDLGSSFLPAFRHFSCNTVITDRFSFIVSLIFRAFLSR